MVDQIGICEKHELPLDRTGECELCRLSEMPSKAPEARSAWWGVIIPLALLLAAVAWGFSTFGPDPEAPPQRGVQAPAKEPAAPLPSDAEPAEPEPEPRPAPTPPPALPEAPAPDQIPRPEDYQTPKPSPEGARQDVTPAAPAVASDTGVPEWKLDLARRRVMVTMYATQWCGVCRRARAYMTENRIEFMELDTDESPQAGQRLRELNPRKTVPTFQIDDLVYVGFREESFEAKLNQAAHRHL